MKNKTIYPYGVGGQTPSGIEIVDYTIGGNDKAASAESVKELAQHVFMGSGSFADAYDASRGSTINFPWLLEDTDEEGNTLKKMIWHVGNGKFIDAIGAEIDGPKNGLNIKSPASGTITFTKSGITNSFSLPIQEGDNNFGFSEIAEAAKEANSGNNTADSYDGKSFTSITKSSGLHALEVDFGGMVYNGGNFPAYYHQNNAPETGRYFKTIKGLVINVSAGTFAPQIYATQIEISGTFTGTTLKMFDYPAVNCVLQKLDLSGLVVNNTVTSVTLPSSEANNYTFTTLDMRNFNTTNATSIIFGRKMFSLNKIIIGQYFSNEKCTTLASQYGDSRFHNTNKTIVCTSETPPVLKNAVATTVDGETVYTHSSMDWIYGMTSQILVPPGCADTYKNNVYIPDVDGEPVYITDSKGVTTKTGWAKYASIIQEYEEGAY